MPEVRRKVVGKVWVTWDCPYCGKKSIHGSERECPGCGRPRGTDIRYNTNEIVGRVAKYDEGRLNQPDWLCQCCDTYNNCMDTECKSCGAPKGASKNYFEVQREIAAKAMRETPTREVVSRSSDESTNSYVAFTMSNQHDRGNSRGKIIAILVALACTVGVGALIWLLVAALSPKNVDVTITRLQWERDIPIQVLETKNGHGWTIPSDARVYDKEWKIKEANKKILDHYETVEVTVEKSEEVYVGDKVTYEYVDNGNGSMDEVEVSTPQYETRYWTETEYEREPVYRYEDIYDWYYHYEYDEWVTRRHVETSGNQGTPPHWGDVELGEKEREGKRKETYKVVGVDADGNEVSYRVSYETYSMISVGSTATFRVNKITGNAELTHLNGDVIAVQ